MKKKYPTEEPPNHERLVIGAHDTESLDGYKPLVLEYAILGCSTKIRPIDSKELRISK